MKEKLLQTSIYMYDVKRHRGVEQTKSICGEAQSKTNHPFFASYVFPPIIVSHSPRDAAAVRDHFKFLRLPMNQASHSICLGVFLIKSYTQSAVPSNYTEFLQQRNQRAIFIWAIVPHDAEQLVPDAEQVVRMHSSYT